MAISKIEAASIGYSGAVLQVVTGSLTTSYSQQSGTATSTGLTVSITPKFSTSKILVLAQLSGTYVSSSSGTAQAGFLLYRNSTNIMTTGSKPAFYTGICNTSGTSSVQGGQTVSVVDSPATTSATSYSVYAQVFQGAGTNYIYLNVDTNTSYITVMEIAG